MGHRTCLDGVRGLAVSLVLIYHLPYPTIPGGFLGVDLFFVLSGFLITSILAEEWDKEGSISLRHFYLRRALRLLPALGLVIATTLVVTSFFESPLRLAQTRRMAIYAITYMANYSKALGLPLNDYFGHTWSLSVEEHFYFLWPLTLLVLLRSGWPKKKIAGVAVVLILLSAGLRVYYWLHDYQDDRAYFYTPARLDGVLLGSLAALIVSAGARPTTPNATALLKLGGGVSFIYLLSAAVCLPRGETYYFASVALDGGMAILICSLILTPIRPLSVLFENRVLRILGKLSYSLYLWHIPVYHVIARYGPGPTYQVRSIVCLLVTTTLATISYVAVERPLMSLRSRYRRGAPRPDRSLADMALAGVSAGDPVAPPSPLPPDAT